MRGGGRSKALRILDYYVDEPDSTIIGTALSDCAQRYGYSVERESVPGGSLISRVLQMGSSDTMPDLLMLDNPDLPQIAQTNILLPLEQYGIDTSDFYDGVQKLGEYDGQTYAVPLTVNTLALFYDPDILSEAGVEVPKDWQELKSAAQTLTAGKQYGFAFSAIANYESTWQFLPFFWSAGANEDDISSPQAIRALTLLTEMLENGSMSSGVLNWGQGDTNSQFIAGNVAMQVNGPWQINSLEIAGKKFEVAPVPPETKGGTTIAPLGGEVWTVPKTGNADKQKAAAQVISCLLEDETMLQMAVDRQTVPVKKTLEAQFLSVMPTMESFVEQVKNARSRTAILGEEWPVTAEAIYTAIQLSLTGAKSPAEALQTAAQEGES